MKNSSSLLIDCGNSFLKWCLSDGETLSAQQAEYHKDTSVLAVFQKVIDDQKKVSKSVVMVSVLGEVFDAGAKRLAEGAGLEFHEVKSQAELAGIKNGYEQAEKIGTDRLVAVVGAYALANQQACIVVDSGTATTIDAIDSAGRHLGGVIFPGLQTSLDSLSGNTELLPLVKFKENNYDANGFAKETSQAIASGCLLSLAGGIDGICDKMQREMVIQTSIKPNLIKRFLCGGNSGLLTQHITGEYEVHDNLVMQGLRIIQNELET